jgi:hypothetical protein
MYDTDTNLFRPISLELAAKFAGYPELLTSTEARQKTFVHLEVGEIITVKGLQFRVGQIAPRKLVLRPLNHLTKD